MRGLGLIGVQVVISLLVVGATLPAIVFVAPGLAGSRIGPWLPFAGIALVFVILRRLWPRPQDGRSGR